MPKKLADMIRDKLIKSKPPEEPKAPAPAPAPAIVEPPPPSTIPNQAKGGAMGLLRNTANTMRRNSVRIHSMFKKEEAATDPSVDLDGEFIHRIVKSD